MTRTFDIPEGLFERAEAAANERGLTLRRFLLDAILDAVEDVEDAKLADEAMAAIRNGEDEMISAEEFWRGLEMDDHLPEVGTKIRRKA